MAFAPTASQQADLEKLLREQLDPKSPNYHRWLTPEQYADRFGLSAADVNRVVQWLRQQGFADVMPARSRTSVSFNGTAAQAQMVFRTPIHDYLVNGELHYANSAQPALPATLRGVVTAVGGLNNFRPKPHGNIKIVHPHWTSDQTGRHFLAPDDFATIYNIQGLYGSGVDGSGEAIAVAGQSDLSTDSNHGGQYDVATFRSVSKLPAANLQVILVPGEKDPGVVDGDVDESNLDLEWSGGVARNAKLIYVNSNNALFTSLKYAIDQNLSPVISISYGICEPTFSGSEISTLQALLQQANAQGQTVVASSGDSGPADCDYTTDPNNPVRSASKGYAVDYPASSPNVTGMGGNEFAEGDDTGGTQYWGATNNDNNGSALSYIPEMAWNDTVQDNQLAASGGGASTLFSKPSWQAGLGVPADGQRDVPDLAFTASADHDGYLACSQSSCVNGYRKSDGTLTVIGGTSAAAPTFAGLVTLIVQKANQRQGNVNPILYQLAANAPNAFHDITTGDNLVPCQPNSKDCPGSGMIGFSTGPGYDQVTGLGSIDSGALSAAWTGPSNPDYVLSSQTQSLSVTRGTPATATITVSALGGFSSGVNLSCSVSSQLTNTTCSISPSTVNPGDTATLTVTAGVLSGRAFLPLQWRIASQLGLFFGFGAFFLPSAAISRKRISRLLSLLVIWAAVLAMVSCGGSNSSGGQNGQGPQSGSVTVSGASGGLQHNLVIATTVN